MVVMFSRPISWIMSLNGDAVVPFMSTRIMSGNLSYVLHNTSVATIMVDYAAFETNEERALWNTP
ncbi:Uncharacterized protein TCM_015000 [Theobroma cacao]|uniref:Uncharacterized protein n=1 Tax=Theobroma cacao TaxID=3641 RepID=A0A061G7F8_THECC|nr:Uncharacterized protein TCM_015000 [Theobroma cacao]